jgi:hypothetical protein
MTEPAGLVGGMFFEYYLFDPLTNFTEEDLAGLLKFFDVELNSVDKVPEGAKRHFEGTVFVPKDDITAVEYADVLDVMDITINDKEALKQLPANILEHFEGSVYRPYSDFGLEDAKLFLSKVISFRLDTTQFESLSPHLKRQFIVQDRSGAPYRWGSRRSG